MTCEHEWTLNKFLGEGLWKIRCNHCGKEMEARVDVGKWKYLSGMGSGAR